ncbi:protein of unknown function [Streptomyces murinus]
MPSPSCSLHGRRCRLRAPYGCATVGFAAPTGGLRRHRLRGPYGCVAPALGRWGRLPWLRRVVGRFPRLLVNPLVTALGELC